jgi:4-hydroxy-3-polyprenylbenzoate decarboxylase
MDRSGGALSMEKPWVIGITGASGVVYGIKLCEFMLSVGKTVHLLITDAGWRVLHDELDWEVTRRQETLEQFFKPLRGKLIYHPIQDIGASVASGSFRTEGMVIIPCSMGTLSAIAHGASDNLLERTADVMLKEGRKLVIVPRETPLHTIHLENMLKLAKMGVRIIPAMPAFYQRPQSLDELVQFLVGKVLDSIDIEHEMYTRWGESQA